MHPQVDADEWTPLHFAALAGWSEGIQLLLEAHARGVATTAGAGHAVGHTSKQFQEVGRYLLSETAAFA
jgi:ankyrin repeat protein